MSRHDLKQGAPVLAAAIALMVLSFFLGAMTTAIAPSSAIRHSPLRLPQACAVITEIDASGNDAYVGAR